MACVQYIVPSNSVDGYFFHRIKRRDLVALFGKFLCVFEKPHSTLLLFRDCVLIFHNKFFLWLRPWKFLLLFILIQFIQFLCTYVDKYTYLLLYSITLLCPFCAFFGKTMDRLMPYTIHSIYFLCMCHFPRSFFLQVYIHYALFVLCERAKQTEKNYDGKKRKKENCLYRCSEVNWCKRKERMKIV